LFGASTSVGRCEVLDDVGDGEGLAAAGDAEERPEERLASVHRLRQGQANDLAAHLDRDVAVFDVGLGDLADREPLVPDRHPDGDVDEGDQHGDGRAAGLVGDVGLAVEVHHEEAPEEERACEDEEGPVHRAAPD
jgi:hypothetical protein